MLSSPSQLLPNRGKRVALVSPGFHGLHESIANGLRQMGLSVTPIVYDARRGLAEKVIEKLRTDLPERLGRDVLPGVRSRTTDVVNSSLQSLTYDILLVVKGDFLDSQIVVEQSLKGKRTILWLYDAFENTRHTLETVSCYDVVASFSKSDVAAFASLGLDARLVPLAADARMNRSGTSNVQRPDVVFFGARYDRREELLQRMHEDGYSVMAYGRDWSRHPRDRVRALSWSRPSFPTASDLPRDQIAIRSEEAVCVLNMHNQSQDGFNLRTFEVPAAAGLELIDRDDVAQYYEPGTEVLVYHSLEEAQELISRAKATPNWAYGIREAGWRRSKAEHTFAHRLRDLLADDGRIGTSRVS